MRRRIIGGRYQIQAEIGSGGMGTVYRARDRRSGITVAVKLLHAHLAQDEAYLERFRREARIATSLESPHVVKVLDYGEDQSVPFIVMEFVAGKDLRSVLRERECVTESEALAIAAQVVDALEEAHRKGVVHRDIKPHNIILAPDGTAKVTDFGIARAEDYSTVSQTGAFFGTVQYAAPEHFQGQFDIRSDIYSLGVVLYHMLSGSPPFAGDTLLEVMRLHVEEPPASLRARVPSVSGETDAIVGRCLAKSPAERFQSPDELSAAIRSALPPETLEQARRLAPPPRGRFPRLGTLAGWWSGRGPGFKLGSAGAAVLIVCGAAFGGALALGVWDMDGASETVAEPSPTRAATGTVPSLTTGPVWASTPLPPEASRIAYLSGNADGEVPTADIYTVQSNGQSTKRIAEGIDIPWDGPIWSPTGDELALCAYPGELQVLSIENPVPRTLYEGRCVGPTWAPDGQRIAFTAPFHMGSSDVWVVDRGGTGLRNLTGSGGDFYVGASWSPGSSQIAFVSDPEFGTGGGEWPDLYVVDVETEEMTQLTNDPSRETEPAWSPDGASIAFGKEEAISIINVESRETRTIMGKGLRPKWSPGGSRLAFIRSAGLAEDALNDLYVVAQDGTSQKKLNQTPGVIRSFSWSPDGQQIAFDFAPEWDGPMKIYVVNADGSSLRPLTGRENEYGPAWSPRLPVPYVPTLTPTSTPPPLPSLTSTPTPTATPTPIRAPTATPALAGRIAFTSSRVWDWDGEIYVMNADGTGQTPLTTNPAWDWKPAWSPDASKIAFMSDRDGNWEVYVMNADGTGQTRLTTNPTYDCHPAWSPDGSKIAFESYREGNGEIYVMNADGTGQTRLTTNPTYDRNPAWSPDGSKIAFDSDRDGNFEIYVMNADRTGQTRLTTNRASDESPAWSPDGSKIAFASFRNGYKIYVMNADGTGETCLTEEPLDGSDPAWSPLVGQGH